MFFSFFQFYFFIFVSGVQNIIVVTYLYPSRSDNPPKSTTLWHCTQLLQYHWLYSLCGTLHPVNMSVSICVSIPLYVYIYICILIYSWHQYSIWTSDVQCSGQASTQCMKWSPWEVQCPSAPHIIFTTLLIISPICISHPCGYFVTTHWYFLIPSPSFPSPLPCSKWFFFPIG